MSSICIRRPSDWARLLTGLAAVYLLFHRSAMALGSDRGQAGVLVGTLVVLATLAVERLLFGTPTRRRFTTWVWAPLTRAALVARCSSAPHWWP